MRKKGIIFTLVGLFLVIGVAVSIPNFFKADHYEDVDISKIKAVTYYGTSALADSDGHALFIDQHGTVQEVKDPSVEWGTIIDANNHVVINSRDEIIQYNKKDSSIEQLGSDCAIYSGYGSSSGFLEEEGMYYELFNQGFVDPNDNLMEYRSTIRWGNGDGHYCSDIPVYSVADGDDGKYVYVLTSEVNELGESEELEILKYTIDGDRLSEERSILREEAFEISHSRIVHDENKLYVLYLEYEDPDTIEGEQYLKLLEVDRNSLTIVNDSIINTYTYEEDPYYFPFNKDGVMIAEGKLYFSTGYGEVYAIDLENGESELQFVFEDYEATTIDMDENVQFKDNKVYFFRYDDKNDHYVMETYTLEGERLDTLKIDDIEQKLGKNGPEKFLYDFDVLQ